MKIRAKLSDKTKQELRGKDGRDGVDGKDGVSPSVEEIATLVLSVIPEPQNGIDGKDGSPDMGKEIVEKINQLPLEDELKISAEHIKGIKDFSEQINILDTRTQLLNQISTTRFTQDLADARYLKLDASNDPLTGTLNFSSALSNGTFISLPDATGSPQSYTMHVGGGDSGGGVGEFSSFIIDFTAVGAGSVSNLFQVQNAEQFVLISGNSASSMGFQEVNTGSEYVWSFTSDQTMNFSATGNVTFASTGIGDGVAVPVTCTSTGGVGTCTTVSGNHGFTTGDFVLIAGANEAGYNGYVSVHRVSNTVFTYPVVASTASPATGTITATDIGTGLIQLSQLGLTTQVTTDISFISTGGGSIFRMDGNGFSTTGASSMTSAPGSVFFGTLETTAPASLTEPLAFFNILTPTMTGRIAQTTFQARIDNSGTTSITIPTGTSASIGGLMIDAPRFIMTGSSTDSTTVYIAGAPTKTSGAGTLGNARALWVDSGETRLDGNILLGTTTGVNLSAATGVLTLAGIGNTNNENITLDFEGTANEVKLNTGTGVTAFKFDVQPQVKAGTSTTYAKVGGKLTTNTTAVGNITTGEDNLMTYSVPANVLATNGDTIRFYASGIFAATVNSKQLRVYFGSTVILVPASDPGTAQDIEWVIDGEIIRTGSATQKAWVRFQSQNVAIGTSINYLETTAPTETLSGAVTLKITGEATATDDIKQETLTVDWLPA